MGFLSFVEGVMSDTGKISSNLEPKNISHCAGKKPDGATVVPWRECRALVWDSTYPDTLT